MSMRTLLALAVALLALGGLWIMARGNGYGRTADGFSVAVLVSMAGGYLLHDETQTFALILLGFSILGLAAMALNKGKLP